MSVYTSTLCILEPRYAGGRVVCSSRLETTYNDDARRGATTRRTDVGSRIRYGWRVVIGLPNVCENRRNAADRRRADSDNDLSSDDQLVWKVEKFVDVPTHRIKPIIIVIFYPDSGFQNQEREPAQPSSTFLSIQVVVDDTYSWDRADLRQEYSPNRREKTISNYNDFKK